MLTYEQREALEEVEFVGMDVESAIDELVDSPTIENLRENLRSLINEAKTLVEMAEKLYHMVGVTEDMG